jgi:hypothetical protein
VLLAPFFKELSLWLFFDAQEGDGGEAQVPVAGAWQSTNRKQERKSQKGSGNFVTAYLFLL